MKVVITGGTGFIGRIDDVMNISGHRIGTMEVESALVSHPKVAEAAVVGRSDPVTGQAVAAFVTLRGDAVGDDALIEELRETVSEKIGPIAKPKSIVFTDDLPKTRSGKIMRRLLRDISEQRKLGDVTTLANADIVEEISVKAAAADLAEPPTAREVEILRLIATGMRNQAIADQLFISLSTVKRHIANVYGKLGVSHRTEAVARANELNLL